MGEGGDCTTTTATWMNRHSSMFVQATRHPFIRNIRDGTVNITSFKRWLAQDYIFVREFVPFSASVLLKACKHSGNTLDVEVVLGGVASLNDEISWFKNEASKWEVHLLSATPQETNIRYCRFLQNLTAPEVSYTVAISAFWAIETVYQQSFAFCLQSGSKTPEELKSTCERWGNADFGQYCLALQSIANRCLSQATNDEVAKAEEVFQNVLSHEIDFWNMSSGDS